MRGSLNEWSPSLHRVAFPSRAGQRPIKVLGFNPLGAQEAESRTLSLGLRLVVILEFSLGSQACSGVSSEHQTDD